MSQPVPSPGELKQLVQDQYTEIVTRGGSCCGPAPSAASPAASSVAPAAAPAPASCCGPAGSPARSPAAAESATIFSDDYAALEGYAPEADYGLGCGLPTEHAALRPGETVLDLGSGAGNDVFVARALVGPGGRAIGVDFTPAMVEKARANAAKLGAENAEFRLGDVEALPVEDDEVDVVVSNCVLNLVPDKPRAFAEMRRVLRPGGRFCVADIVSRGPLPPSVRGAAALYAGCVSGAVDQDAYLAMLREAGFEDVRVVRTKVVAVPEAALAALPAGELAAYRAAGGALLSVTVTGRVPGRVPAA